nr:ammonium transporter [Planosporangium mesophilum]
MIAATLVGLMSIPGLVLLYGGLVQRKWVVNTMLMAFAGFALVLVAWVLYEFSMAFGRPLRLGPGVLGHVVGVPRPILDPGSMQGRAHIPLLDGAMPDFRYPKSTLAYFHFAFAAITPLLFLGSVLGRMSFRAWLVFVPLWSGLVYSVNAFLLWGGGWWAHAGALDYSGGYVIHLAAGTTGFTAAAVIGPRLAGDRARPLPNNLPMVAAGAGILWLGWNGFNGGDMYFGGANAAAAVLNTNLSAAVALLTWLLLDMAAGPQRKPTFLGAVNGMITGLVAITPAAGFVNGWGALVTGLVASVVVWLSWNRLNRLGLFRRVDDTLGVFHTHGVAGLTGGLLVGLLADPAMAVYLRPDGSTAVAAAGALYGHPRQLALQAGAAVTVIAWDALLTFAILSVLGRVMALRLPDDVLESGDLGVHDEEAYPGEPVASVPPWAAPPTAMPPPAPPAPAQTAPPAPPDPAPPEPAPPAPPPPAKHAPP